MNRKLWILAIGVGVTGTGCLSMQSSSTLDAINSAMSVQPYVEGYVEYAGPNAKWSGPSSFILHVVAKDPGNAQITVTPPLFKEMGPAPVMGGRVPASEGYPMELAREHLAHLATSIQGTDATFRGCLSPVRVRLVRADGSLLEKQGCRSQSSWSRVASETVSHFIAALTHGVPAPTRGTAATTATTPSTDAATRQPASSSGHP